MPKCNNCQYLCYPEYESSYTECRVFGDEPPEKYATEDGCRCNSKTLEKILRQNEEALEKEHEAFIDWFLNKESDE